MSYLLADPWTLSFSNEMYSNGVITLICSGKTNSSSIYFLGRHEHGIDTKINIHTAHCSTSSKGYQLACETGGGDSAFNISIAITVGTMGLDTVNNSQWRCASSKDNAEGSKFRKIEFIYGKNSRNIITPLICNGSLKELYNQDLRIRPKRPALTCWLIIK